MLLYILNVYVSKNFQTRKIFISSNCFFTLQRPKTATEVELGILKEIRNGPKECHPTDAFLIRVGDSMKKLPSKLRRKFELEMLTKLDELEDAMELEVA